MVVSSFVARGIAGALLAGPWLPDLMATRVRRTLGRRGAWITKLVMRVRRRFPNPPPAADLRAALLADDELSAAVERLRQPLLIRRWLWATEVMTAAPFATARPLPALPTAGDLAQFLGLEIGQLMWLADERRRERHTRGPGPLRHYRYRWLSKQSGGFRLLEAPKPRLKRAQRRLLRAILDLVPPHDAAHGFTRGRSIISHSSCHVGAALVLRLDLRDFFPSISAPRVRGLFRTLGYPPPVASLLCGLCTNSAPLSDVLSILPTGGGGVPAADSAAEVAERRRAVVRYRRPHLPAGAPTSPALANLCAFRLDQRLAAAAAAVGATYTRYADDLTFSGPESFAPKARRLFSLACQIAVEEGFVVHGRKTRFMRRGARQIVTGVVVNDRLNIKRPRYESLKATVHNCLRHGPSSQNHAGHEDFRAHLSGRIAFVESIHPERGRRLRQQAAAIRWDE